MLERLQTRWPEIHCLALVETAEQMMEAKTDQAEAILFKGYRLDELLAVINRLLTSHLPAPPGARPASEEGKADES